jgi:hypothetical protein
MTFMRHDTVVDPRQLESSAYRSKHHAINAGALNAVLSVCGLRAIVIFCISRFAFMRKRATRAAGDTRNTARSRG